MLPLIAWLNSQACDSILVKFTGHYKSSNTEAITVRTWQQDMLNGYEAGREVAAQHKIPLFFVGYSLGGLLGIDMLFSLAGNTAISKQILLAPAVAVRDTASILKLLFWWDSLYLPSLTPPKYRANKSLSIHAYSTMFKILSNLKKPETRLTIPTLAVIDTMDELISTQKLIKFLDRYITGQNELVRLNSKMKDRQGGYHHLIISKETMGEKNWELFTEKTKTFLFT